MPFTPQVCSYEEEEEEEGEEEEEEEEEVVLLLLLIVAVAVGRKLRHVLCEEAEPALFCAQRR